MALVVCNKIAQNQFTERRLAMLRKCKAGRDQRPAYFHGWFQFGNQIEGLDGMAIVEFEDGTTDYFAPMYISFDAPPTANTVEGANLQTNNSAMDEIAAIADTIEECFQVDGNELGLLQVNKLRQLRQ
jgi:hypothetical protein